MGASYTAQLMGKAGQALKRVLEQYDITQGKLSSALEISTSNVYRWCNEVRDPTGETIVELVEALKKINPQAARQFVRLYLWHRVDSIEDSTEE